MRRRRRRRPPPRWLSNRRSTFSMTRFSIENLWPGIQMKIHGKVVNWKSTVRYSIENPWSGIQFISMAIQIRLPRWPLDLAGSPKSIRASRLKDVCKWWKKLQDLFFRKKLNIGWTLLMANSLLFNSSHSSMPLYYELLQVVEYIWNTTCHAWDLLPELSDC